MSREGGNRTRVDGLMKPIRKPASTSQLLWKVEKERLRRTPFRQELVLGYHRVAARPFQLFHLAESRGLTRGIPAWLPLLREWRFSLPGLLLDVLPTVCLAGNKGVLPHRAASHQPVDALRASLGPDCS